MTNEAILNTLSQEALRSLLKDLTQDNCNYFEKDDSEEGQRIHIASRALWEHLVNLYMVADHIASHAHEFDYSPEIPGNGFRSFLSVVDCCTLHSVYMLRTLTGSRHSYFFRKSHYMKEVEAWSQVAASLHTIFCHLKTLLGWCKPGDIFPSEYHSPEELLMEAENLNQYCFYGRCLGFQFAESLRKPLKAVSIGFASFSEIYYNTGSLLSRTTGSFLNGSRYLLDPELRARRIVNVSQRASVGYCKSFWLLADTDIFLQLPSLALPSIEVNKVISIPAEILEVPSVTMNKTVVVFPPSVHIGTQPLPCRLLSNVTRRGMIGHESKKGSTVAEPSSGLIIHCHGGGFIACSSQSHEVYLRDWTIGANTPIFSIDYSLAPEAPFPRALEETFYAYCWALNNCQLLGSTAERICVVGDSAGGNLMMGLTMMCIERGIRVPSGAVLIYTPLLIQFLPSPSKMLCMMDPIIPFGFMMKCIEGYAGHTVKLNQKPSSLSLPIISDDKAVTVVNDNVVDDDCLVMKIKCNDGDGNMILSEDVASKQPSFYGNAVDDEVQPMEGDNMPISPNCDSDTMTTVSLSSVENTTVQSDDYITKFLESYTSSVDTSADIPLNRMSSVSDESEDGSTQQSYYLRNKLAEAANMVSCGINTGLNILGLKSGGSGSTTPQDEANKKPPLQRKLTVGSITLESKVLDSAECWSPAVEFQKFCLPKDPYLSPYLMTDETVKKLPHISFVSLVLDPCLDDSIMMSKRMRSLGKTVHLQILPDLPHGFLNFAQANNDAYEGSQKCLARVKAVLFSKDDCMK